MRLSQRDLVATVLVAAAGLLYILWAFDSAPFNLSSTRATGIAILALGFLASATAVVPTFIELLHGNKTYLALTSTLGVIATIAGIQMLITASGTALAVLMVTMIAMWIIATGHHRRTAKTGTIQSRAS
jgi:hypothetical protein